MPVKKALRDLYIHPQSHITGSITNVATAKTAARTAMGITAKLNIKRISQRDLYEKAFLKPLFPFEAMK